MTHHIETAANETKYFPQQNINLCKGIESAQTPEKVPL